MTLAVILAGGLGTRLRGTVPDVPKPMAPIGGRPFLEYQLDYWIGKGIDRFVLSVGYRHEVIMDHFGASYKGIGLSYVIEHTPMGTGGGLLLAVEESAITAPFLLLNGDTYFEADWKVLKECSQAKDADWCFSLFRAEETGRYMGLELSPQGQIMSLKSHVGYPGRLANGGVYWVEPRALHGGRFSVGEKASLENDMLPVALMSGRRLFGIEFSGTFIDIGVPDDYRRAASLLAV
jgi:D-glycero-alpha-D-manno-heptose 1-phosphate guanylyltransferase